MIDELVGSDTSNHTHEDKRSLESLKHFRVNDHRWHAASAPHLPERSGRLTISAARTNLMLVIPRIVRPSRARPSGSLLEFSQLRSFDSNVQSVPAFLLVQASAGPRSSGKVALKPCQRYELTNLAMAPASS